MINIINREKLEKTLEKRVVYDVLVSITDTAMRWNKGGALIHRVRAMGYLAETFSRNIREGNTCLTSQSTFEEMQQKLQTHT